MSKIYLASSWRNAVYPTAYSALVEAGHAVYDFRDPATGFSWADVDPDWEHAGVAGYLNLINDPLAVAGFEADFKAMHWADTLVLVLPCGRSGGAA
jgi:hypothetical protein